MAERANLRRRPQRTTVKDILRTAVNLEKKAMALYMQFTRIFEGKAELRKFWFGMARHEASHLGALALVEGVVDNDPRVAESNRVWFDPSTVVRLRALLNAYGREAQDKVSVARAFEMAIDVESSELEDVVVDLLHVVREQMVREQAIKLLIHDLSDLSYMVEKFTKDESLLARADALVDHRLDAFSPEAQTERAADS